MVNLNRTVADVIDTNIPHWAALTAVTTDAENGAYAPGVTTGTLTVTLHEDEDVRSWLTQEGATDPNDKLEGAYAEYSRSTVLGASTDGSETIIPLYIAPDGGQMVGKLEFPVSTEDDVTHVVEFFELQDGKPITSGEEEDAKPVPFFGIYTSFVAQQAVFLGEGDVTFTTPADWPEEGQRVFGDQLTAPFTLSFTVVDQSATWKDTSKVTVRDSEGKLVDEDAHFLWESSNPQVATINEKGEITILTNGAVSFTLTALNGNVEKTPADLPQEATTYAYTYATPEILVGVGNSPFLTVPESLRTTTVRGGQPATVLWSSNLTEKNRDNATGVEEPDSVETTFTLTLYKAGDFDESAGGPNEDAQGEALDPVRSSMKDVKSSALIPASMIPYANGQPYYVTISATDNATGKPYTSWAKIEVQSPPAVVELARPSSLYITDEMGTLPLTWSLANFNGDGREFRLVITNNTTSAVQGTDVNAENQSGSFTMNIADVANEYRDTYTVEVAAKNATDSTWSYDSFVLYVYDRAALQQFVVDGKDTANGSAITLSNGEKEYIQKLIDSQNSTAAQQAVWDTGRDISLTADVSMDPDKPWLEVPDQFAWSAEDTTAASGTGQTHATLNYQQGALYEDITRYQRTSYGPTAEFRLSGLSDGTTKVTAEHVNTGTVAELIVNVDTLQDKLFLFQFTPAVETTLRYTNGDGVQKEATSMADGRAAIYEESGIQGDVYLESQQGDTEYFGTLYNENLVSSEKDSTQLELYPVNYMTLRKAAQVPIYLKKPDGTPYLGQVTVHGGVYLNDAYAPDARLDTDDGKEGYTVNLAQDNGAHTLDIVVTSGDKTHTYRVEITRPSTGGGTGGGGSTRYPITVPEEDHGTVSVSPSRASSGQTVTITVTPDEGYKVGSVTVKRPNGSTVPVTGQGNGKYIFTMPSGGVTVDVTFIPEDWPFVDVTEDKWYYDAVAYVYQQGIMVGMSETTFEPNTTVNRAQVVQMLYNLEGQPQVSGDSGFSDIRDGQWYAKAVAWASANDVVAGYEDGTFRPTRAVTREEFAQILYNYAKCKGYGLSASADLGKFPDSGQVSSWAETALGWANGNGLINGHDDGRLDPKCSTIRAQAASILMNFDKGFAQEG